MVASKPIVSIIVPVYNAESTLHITLKALKEQTYCQTELVFINDCSKDSSLDMINEFVITCDNKQFLQIKIISHEQNRGVASARNTGLNHAAGDYIYFLDADDSIEPDSIELLMKKAVLANADIVGCNWFLTFEKNERKMNQPSFSTPWEAVEKMLNGSMRWNLWLFMVRRSLYENNQIRFIPGMNMGEDMMVMIKLFTYAGKVAYLDKALYHYGQSNVQSLTKIYSERHIQEVSYNVKEVECFLLNSKFANKTEQLINYLKLNIKLPLLISDKNSQYTYWRSWFPEVDKMTMSNKDTALRIRLLQWAAVNKQDWIVKLHYYLVIRLVYGIIYK